MLISSITELLHWNQKNLRIFQTRQMTKMVCRTVFLKEIYIEQHFLCEADPHVSIENTEGGRCIKR